MKPNRRDFIKTTILAGASLPFFNIGRAQGSASQVIRHASIGAWGQAGRDIGNMIAQGVELTAVAEVDDAQLALLQKAHPNQRFKAYKDWRELLDKEHKNLDSINVSVPDHMHAPVGLTAMQLGLHVYGQKPLTQTVHEARQMTQMAKDTGVVTQMGVQFTTTHYERMTVQMVQDGVVGKIKEAYVFSYKTWGDPEPLPPKTDPIPAGLEWDLWCGVAAERPYIHKYYHPIQWRRRLDFGTGTLGDMGCHIYSPMYRALGVGAPIWVKSIGGQPNQTNWAINEKVVYLFPGSQYTAADTIKVEWTDGENRVPPEYLKMFGDKMPEQGCIFVGTDGVLLQGHQALPVAYPRENYQGYHYPRLEPRDHYSDFIKAVQGEPVTPLANFIDFGGPLTEAILLGSIATRFPNETLHWDATNMQFKNNPKATQYLRKDYRKGWEIAGA